MDQVNESKEQNELMEFRILELEKTYEEAEEKLSKRETLLEEQVMSKLSTLLSNWGLAHLLTQEEVRIHQNNGHQNEEDDHDPRGLLKVSNTFSCLLLVSVSSSSSFYQNDVLPVVLIVIISIKYILHGLR